MFADVLDVVVRFMAVTAGEATVIGATCKN